jgi:hypothetical protein
VMLCTRGASARMRVMSFQSRSERSMATLQKLYHRARAADAQHLGAAWFLKG